MNTTYETSFGLEYTIIPPGSKNYKEGPGDFSFPSVRLDIEDGRYELVGYRVEVRYYVRVTETTSYDDPEMEDTVTIRHYYPNFRVTEMTFEKTSPGREVFVNEDGTQTFPSPPGAYGLNAPAIAGITDGSEYSYFKVFDDAVVSWLPRCGTINEEYVEDEPVPVDPQDDNDRFPKYPMDALSAYLPDMREAIDLTYTITTTYEADGWGGEILSGVPPVPPQSGTESANINHTCTQDVDDNFGPKLKAALNNCYFTNKYYHVSLHEDDHPRLYDDEGELIDDDVDLKEPEYDEYTLVNTVYDYGIRPVNGPFIPIENRTPDD
jgi:hypothetical protein